MLCQRCHKSLATVRYAEVVDGKVAELHLCEVCMADQQGAEASGFALSGDAPQPRRSALLRTGPSASEVPNMACSICGCTLQDVLVSRTAGCGECYRMFGDHLDEVLREGHFALRHRGKSPHLDDARARIRAELQAKRALLRSALREENYEEAAILRDSIAQLESEQAAALATKE